jgi:hypothetical protein
MKLGVMWNNRSVLVARGARLEAAGGAEQSDYVNSASQKGSLRYLLLIYIYQRMRTVRHRTGES